jgi:F-type H+-transporting ATPase subunit b
MPLGIDFTQIFLHMFNVVILAAGLYLILYAPVKKFMQDRENQYKDIDEKTRAKLSEAEGLKAEYEEKLSKADEEIAEKKAAAADELSEIRTAAQNEAKQQAEKIINDARREAENEKNSIVDGAKDEIIHMVEDAAKKAILTGNVSEAYDLFLDEAERS